MKPRPNIATIAIVSRSTLAPQRRRAVQTRPSLSCHLWHDRSRPKLDCSNTWDGITHLGRYASTSAKPLAKDHHAHHSRETKAPSPTKSHKTNVPAKASTKPSPTVLAKRTLSQPHVPVLKTKEALNPPSFTHAPDLTVPPRGRDQGFFSYAWKSGRAYLSFYKSGVSNVRQTSKLAKTLRAKKRKDPAALTRAEWQIVARSRRDMLRLPAFGLVFLVFGEWTPLLVMYITPCVPEPCRIPGQVEKRLRKIEARRRERMDVPLRHIERLRKAGSGASTTTVVSSSDSLRSFDTRQASHLDLLLSSARLDCHAQIWDLIGVIPPRTLLKMGLERKLKYLRKDDELIRRDGGWGALEKREVERACTERGIDVLGRREEEVRRGLAGWFEGK